MAGFGTRTTSLKAHYDTAKISDSSGLSSLLAVQRICTENFNLSVALLEKGLSSRGQSSKRTYAALVYSRAASGAPITVELPIAQNHRSRWG
jgi:hypothetical protein